MIMAVLSQYELPSGFLQALVPMASTMFATQDGPPVVFTLPAWSEFAPSGITQDTPRKPHLEEMSVKTSEGARSTFVLHSLPEHFWARTRQMCLIAFGAIQMLLAFAP